VTRIRYVNVWYGEIVLCEAPVGTSLFQVAMNPMPWTDEVKGRWRLITPVNDNLEPRVRVCPLAHEAEIRHLGNLVKDAHRRLPPTRQNGGTLGVILKGERYHVPETKALVQTIGFFHVPLTDDDSLDALFLKEPPRKDLPTQLSRQRPYPRNMRVYG